MNLGINILEFYKIPSDLLIIFHFNKLKLN
jgi:hypothetical protein